MYLLSFFVIYLLILRRLKKEDFFYSKETIQSYFFWAILGAIIGGRIGYVLFYNLDYFLKYPLEIILPFSYDNGWHYTGISGMSYHGGLVGVGVASVLFCRENKIKFSDFASLIIPALPLGYTFGRIGNFINGELYGRVTNVFWGMYFPLDLTNSLRHPSQLYEAFFEGVCLFVLFWSIRKNKLLANFFFSLYLIFYGLVRFVIEFFREPDAQLGFVWGKLTMGQVLCLVMVIFGLVIFIIRFGKIYSKQKVLN
jgi:phosphatidylglycerol:prolipoprotein diacylglycerol transferase